MIINDVKRDNIIQQFLDLDYEEFPNWLYENELNGLSADQIEFLKTYIEKWENDTDDSFLDSDEQEQMLEKIFEWYGVDDNYWDIYNDRYGY